ncbi:ABC transporter substrate-binding protein [Actinomadura rugatobispora]|uniref:ABC transporter substrate-binding protein n=1 Tax=Actinomadura rugatobispora TaxID=1994 RepID=A0ABW1A4U6_9ACTN|nr:ABC transporter substrate-binding protein [Actinomadura rugatobispora]
MGPGPRRCRRERHHPRRTRHRTPAAAALALALTASVTAACGTGGPADRTPEFRWGYSTRATTLNPHRGAQFDLIFLHPVYDALIKIGESGEFEPGLATAWKLSDDGLTFDLTLRAGVRFQDGAALDAAAVKASLEHGKQPKSTVAGDLEVVRAVEVVDPLHVRLRLAGPGGHLLGVLAGEAGMIISPRAVNSPDLAKRPVGAGPYRIASYTMRQVTYEKWDGYWDAGSVTMPRLKIITMTDDSTRLRALLSRQLDAAYLRPSHTARLKSAGITLLSKPRTLIYTAVVNTARPGLKDPRVRTALSQAIDRASIDENLQNDGCTPTVQPFIQQYWPHVPGLDARPEAVHDPARARRLLAEAGHGEGREPLTLTITSANITQYQILAEALQAQFKDIGIRAELRVVDTAQSTPTLRTGKFDLMVTPIDVGRPDPSTFIADYYLPGGAVNPGRFQVPDGPARLAEARRRLDTAGQQGPLRDLFRKAYEAGPPIIPICAPDNVVGVQPDAGGIVIPPTGTYEFRGTHVAG